MESTDGRERTVKFRHRNFQELVPAEVSLKVLCDGSEMLAETLASKFHPIPI